MPADVRRHVPLAAYTTMGVGGPAEFLLEAHSNDELAQGLSWARERGLPVVVLGHGSNVIVGDSGLPGLVIVNQRPAAIADCISTGAREGGLVLARVDGGAGLARLAHYCATKGISGLEWAANLPGSVAAAVVGNAGAFGGAMADSVTAVEVLAGDGKCETIGASELQFAYRCSALQAHGAVVAWVRLQLAADEPESCLLRHAAVSDQRRQRQPAGRSAGSVFRNPEGVSAGVLLDRSAMKSVSVGDAVVSDAHANFIINRGAATAADVLALMGRMRSAVYERFGVRLEPEVKLLGDLVLEAL